MGGRHMQRSEWRRGCRAGQGESRRAAGSTGGKGKPPSAGGRTQVVKESTAAGKNPILAGYFGHGGRPLKDAECL